MRISEASKKFSVTPSEIFDFLLEKGRPVSSYNSRLDEEQKKLIFEEFQADNPVESDLHENTLSKKDIENTEESFEVSIEDRTDKPLKTNLKEDDLDTINPENSEKIEIPKPKLQGIKVVGKIELPEKSVEEEKSEDNPDSEEDSKAQAKGDKYRRVKNISKAGKRQPGKKRKPRKAEPELSYQQKIKLEKEREERRKKAIKRREKERKKKRYINQVQSKVELPQQKSNRKSKKKSDREDHIRREKPQYKNPIRRLWAWLNGEYDDIY